MADRTIGIPVDLLAQPRDGEAMIGRWWVTRQDRTLAVFWQGGGSRGWTPQCNRDVRLAEHFLPRYSGGFDNETGEPINDPALPLLIPVAFLGPWNEHDGYLLTTELRDHMVVLL